MFSVSLLALNLVLQITVLEPVLCIQSAEFSDAAKSTGSTSERRVEGPDQLLPTSDNQAAKPAGKPAELYSTVPGEDCSDPTARAVSAGQDNKCDAPMPPQSPPAPLSNRVRSELTFVNETVDGLGTPVSPYIAAETNELLFKLVFSYVGNGLPAVVGDFEASDIEVTSKSGLVRGEHFEVEIQPPLETWELAYAAVLLRAVGRWPNCDNHDQPVKVSLRRFSVHPPSLEVVEVMPSTSLYILWMPGQEHEAGCEGTSPTQTPAEPPPMPPPQLPPWHAAPKLSRQAPAESPPTPGMPFPLAAPPEPAEAPIQTPPQTPAETPPSSPSLAPLAPAEARVDAPSPLSAPVAADAPLPQPPLVLAPVDPADLGARVQEAPEPPSPGPSASSEGNSAISTGVIAAVAVGGAAVLAGAAVAALFLLRRKRARQTVAVSSAPAGGGEGQPLVESKTAADSAARSEAEEASEDEGEGAGNADEEAESSEREEEKEDGQG